MTASVQINNTQIVLPNNDSLHLDDQENECNADCKIDSVTSPIQGVELNVNKMNGFGIMGLVSW